MSSPKRRPPSRPARTPAPSPSRRPLLVVAGVVAVVVIALVAALIAGSGDDDGTETSGGQGSGNEAPAGDLVDDAPATATGDDLPPLPESGADPAVGSPLPRLSGTSMEGSLMTVPESGRPTMIVFLAHWCPHCQAEVPVVQQWVDDGGLPDDVDLVAVSTAIDPRRPNHPPSAWLRREGWTSPVLVDGNDVAARAAGVSAYPFFVAVDGDGNVVARTSGELSADQLTAFAGELSGTGS